MFTKKTKSDNKNEKTTNPSSPENANTLQSWVTGKFGSFLIFTAVGFALYKFGIINKLTNYFKKDKGSATENN